jgi:hypothetical protein
VAISDAFGITHPTALDPVTDEGLEHIDGCEPCQQIFATALTLRRVQREHQQWLAEQQANATTATATAPGREAGRARKGAPRG